MRKLCLVLAACVGLAGPAHAYRISDDGGGKIGDYVQQFKRVNYSGERVEIDGACLSACTLVLGIVPRNKICVTKRAVLGFHAAWAPDFWTQKPRFSAVGTQAIWEIYPSKIKHLITMRGGLTQKMIFVRGHELMSMYPECH